MAKPPRPRRTLAEPGAGLGHAKTNIMAETMRTQKLSCFKHRGTGRRYRISRPAEGFQILTDEGFAASRQESSVIALASILVQHHCFTRIGFYGGPANMRYFSPGDRTRFAAALRTIRNSWSSPLTAAVCALLPVLICLLADGAARADEGNERRRCPQQRTDGKTGRSPTDPCQAGGYSGAAVCP